MDPGKREGARCAMVRRKFKEGAHPALAQGTENDGKCDPSCGCASALCLSQASLSRSDYETQQWKCSHFVDVTGLHCNTPCCSLLFEYKHNFLMCAICGDSCKARTSGLISL